MTTPVISKELALLAAILRRDGLIHDIVIQGNEIAIRFKYGEIYQRTVLIVKE